MLGPLEGILPNLPKRSEQRRQPRQLVGLSGGDVGSNSGVRNSGRRKIGSLLLRGFSVSSHLMSNINTVV